MLRVRIRAISAPYSGRFRSRSGDCVGEVVYPKDMLEVRAFAEMLMHWLMVELGMFFEALLEAAFRLTYIGFAASRAFDMVYDPILLGVRYPVFHAAEFSDFASGK